MGDFKLTTVEEFEAATARLLETGDLPVSPTEEILVCQMVRFIFLFLI